MTNKIKYLPHLDSMRLFAMLLIFMSHCYFLNLSVDTEQVYNKYFCYSGLGVEFFIILSGFFASYTYREESYSLYVKKKIKRLFPVHWICLILGGYLLGIHCAKIPITTPVSCVLLQSIMPWFASTNPPSWTISTLFIIYLITPVLIRLCIRIPYRWYLALALILGVGSTVINWYLYDPSNETMFWFLYVSPYFRIVTFSIGLFLGLHIRNCSHEKLSRSLYLSSILEIFSLSFIVCIMFLWGKQACYWYTIPISICILIFAKGDGGVSRLLQNRHIVSVSKISYCFYLVHFPILEFMGYLLQYKGVNTASYLWVCFGMSLIISLLLSSVIHLCVEKQVSNIKITYSVMNQ